MKWHAVSAAAAEVAHMHLGGTEGKQATSALRGRSWLAGRHLLVGAVVAYGLLHRGDDGLTKLLGAQGLGAFHLGGKVGSDVTCTDRAFHALDDEVSGLFPA